MSFKCLQLFALDFFCCCRLFEDRSLAEMHYVMPLTIKCLLCVHKRVLTNVERIYCHLRDAVAVAISAFFLVSFGFSTSFPSSFSAVLFCFGIVFIRSAN